MAGEVATLAAQIAPLAAVAAGTYGRAVLAKAWDDVADTTIKTGLRVLQRIFGRRPDGGELPAALAEVVRNPGNRDCLDLLTLQITRALTADAALRGDVSAIVAGANTQLASAGRDALAAGRDLVITTNYYAREDLGRGTSEASQLRRVQELTEDFVGRQNVFDAIAGFLGSQDRGMFTIVGDPGEGKSAICAEFSRRNGCVIHFNLRAEGTNRVAACLANISEQLATRFGVTAASPPSSAEDLAEHWNRLLEQAAGAARGRVIVVIDALDEVDSSDHPDGANILFLPVWLPENVYFLLTRRRTRVPLVNGTPQQTFDLGDNRAESRADAAEYVRRAVPRLGLARWIQARRMDEQAFADAVAAKSECNFMYLRYVLPEIAAGAYRSVDADRLPEGLRGYYEDHWQRMGMLTRPLPRKKIRVVYVMAEMSRPVSRSLLAGILREDPTDIQLIIDEWRQFLHSTRSDGETVHSIYHASFLDFLHDKEIVQAAGESIQGINQLIADRLYDDLFGAGNG